MKHRGIHSRLPGTDLQFTIRRPNQKGVTPLKSRERFKDRRPPDRQADKAFVRALIEQFGNKPFVRGNLDAGRLSWLFGREVKPYGNSFDPKSYGALLILDLTRIQSTFPDAFEPDRKD